MAEATKMTPAEALRQLRQAEGYREGVTVRAGGLTWMIWGLALGMGMLLDDLFPPFVGGWALGVGAAFLGGLLPLLAAAFATARIWDAHAVEPHTRLPVPHSLAVLAFIAPVAGFLAAMLVGLGWDVLAHFGWAPAVEYLDLDAQAGVAGAGAWALLFGFSTWSGKGPSKHAGSVAGAFLLVISLPLLRYIPSDGEPGLSVADAAIGLEVGQWPALLVMLAFFAAGAYTFRRG